MEMERSELLFEHMPDAILLVDKDGQIQRLNAQAARVFGYTPPELHGQPIEILLPERFRARHLGHRNQYLAEPHTRPMGAGLELYGRRKDCSEFPVDIMLSPMDTPSGKQVLAVIRDITERKRNDEALRASREMFQRLFENAPDGIVVVDNSGNIVQVNTQIERLFRYDRESLLGQPIEKLLPERYRGRHVQHRDSYFAAPRARPMGAGGQLFGLRSDGSEFPVDIMLSPVGGEEGALVLGVVRDITERIIAEEQSREASRREVMLREIHHRVKNNLQVVSSLLSLQSQSLQDDTLLSLIKDSQNRVQSIALIHEKLYRTHELGDIDFADYVRDLTTHIFNSYGVNSMIALPGRSGLTSGIRLDIQVTNVHLSLDTAVPCGLVINELVSNSLKHAFPDQCGGLIRINLLPEGDGYLLSVSDDGVGFPADLDFRHTESLGLRLVNILVAQLSGSIALHNENGTRFDIHFAELKYKERH